MTNIVANVTNQIGEHTGKQSEVDVLLGVLKVILPPIIAFILGRWGFRGDRRRIIGSEFRKPFNNLCTHYKLGKYIDHAIIASAVYDQERAITEFESQLRRNRRRRTFADDCTQYRKCRDKCLSLGGQKPIPPEDLAEFRKSIEKLMEYTR